MTLPLYYKMFNLSSVYWPMEVYQSMCGSAILHFLPKKKKKEQCVLRKSQDWQGVFLHFDRDRSGTIDGNELQEALRQFGYRLSPQLLNLLQRKYGADCFGARSHPRTYLTLDDKGSVGASGAGGRHAAPPGITFDRFVRACVVVKQVTESFAKLDTDRDGWIQINYETFLETILTLP